MKNWGLHYGNEKEMITHIWWDIYQKRRQNGNILQDQVFVAYIMAIWEW